MPQQWMMTFEQCGRPLQGISPKHAVMYDMKSSSVFTELAVFSPFWTSIVRTPALVVLSSLMQHIPLVPDNHP